jgi:hypothetical protein
VSLINDALRKARQAAAEHEARPPDGPFQARKAYPSRRPNRRTGVVLVVLVAVAAGLLGAALAWWLTVDQQPLPEPEAFPRQRPAAAESSAKTPAAPVGAEDQDVTPPTSRATGQEIQPGESRQQPAPDASAGSSRELSEPSAAMPTPSPVINPSPPTAVLPAEPSAANESGGERVFVLDADVGYATLNLGFIVARSTNPFAEINGIEVRVGSEIEGFTVEAIEADRVVLRDDRGPLVLTVK